jgi:hypothetical protein
MWPLCFGSGEAITSIGLPSIANNELLFELDDVMAGIGIECKKNLPDGTIDRQLGVTRAGEIGAIQVAEELLPCTSPLRCAPVEMTIHLGNAKSRLEMNCHLDRSAAEWRDLQF